MTEPRPFKIPAPSLLQRTGTRRLLVLFRPGLACKPRLWLGLRRLWLSPMPGQAKAVNDSLALAWLGLGRGFYM